MRDGTGSWPGWAATGERRTAAIGGLAAIALAAGYVAIMPLFAAVGAPPVGAQERLAFHATGQGAWWGIVALSVITDLLFVPVAVGLHDALRLRHGALIVAGTVFTLLFVVLDLAVLWPAKVALLTLGDAWGSESAAGRGILEAGAQYPAAVLDSGLTPVYSVLTLSLGILLTGIAMRGERGARAAAIAGVATGVVGIASVVETVATGAFPVLVVIASLLTIVWLVLVGAWLLRRPLGADPRGTVRT